MGRSGLQIGMLLAGLALVGGEGWAQTPVVPSRQAPRTAADQKPEPYPLKNFYAPPPTPTEVGRTIRPLAYRFAPCLDEKLAALVGLSREDALQKIRRMNLMQSRFLALESPVTYERVPERLTLVITATGKISRAFCR